MDISDHPLSPPLISLLNRLTILHTNMNLADNQIHNFKILFNQSYIDKEIDISNAIAGFNFFVRDLSVDPKQKYHEYLPGGQVIKIGEQYLEVGNEIIETYSAFTLAQCYDAFETFLKDTVSYYFYNWTPEKSLKSLNKMPIEHKKIDEWRMFF